MAKVEIVLRGRNFMVPQRQAKALVDHGIAKYPAGPRTYKTRVLKAEAGGMAALRSEYEVALGKKPFMGWDADTLRAKMQEYLRRDMQADENAAGSQAAEVPEAGGEGGDVQSPAEQG